MTTEVITQVAIVTGRVLHGGTGRPVDRGSVRVAADRGPLAFKYLPDGTFALSGRPEAVFPDLATAASSITLRVAARSPQWRAGVVEVTLPTIAIPAGHDFYSPAGLLTITPAPPATVLLPADPLVIRGRVIRAGLPVSPANVELLPPSGPVPPPQAVNVNGEFAFPPVGLPPETSIRCTSGAAVVTRLLVTDYASAVHYETFRLPP